MKVNKQIAALVLTGVLAAGSALPAFAAAAPDGYTDASATPAAANGAYAAWQERWETMKNDWTQVSLSPGSDDTQMNFAWYSKTPTASFRVATDAAMIQLVQEQTITGQAAVKDSENTQYYSCKATASNLKPGTYYYQIGNQAATPLKVQDSSDGFSFIDREGNIIQNLVLAIIGEGDIFKANIPLSNLGICASLLRFIGALVNQGKDPTG